MSARDLEGVLDDIELAASSATTVKATIDGALVGNIVGFKDNGATPLVIYPDQPGTAALPARAILDLNGEHIGRDVVLMFASGDPLQPIVMGWVRSEKTWRFPGQPGQVELDADGERLVVIAKERIVLRCGKASITLTKAGKVLIEGSYLLSRSAGVNRIKGGSVQLN